MMEVHVIYQSAWTLFTGYVIFAMAFAALWLAFGTILERRAKLRNKQKGEK